MHKEKAGTQQYIEISPTIHKSKEVEMTDKDKGCCRMSGEGGIPRCAERELEVYANEDQEDN